MKILQVINSLSGGGAESFVTDLSISLANDHGADISILVYAGILDTKGKLLASKLKKNGIKIYSLDIRKNYKKIVIPYYFYKLIVKINPDIIHSHLDHSDFFLATTKLIFRSFKFKMIRTLHNNALIKRIPLIIHKGIFFSFDKTVACSDSVKNEFQLSKFRSNIIPIPNGISIIDLPKKIFKKKRNDKVIFISIGSFTPRLGVMQKAQDITIRALSQINHKYIEVHFLGDGTMLNDMKLLAVELNVSEKVVFHGLVDNVHDYFAKADALIFPSRFEGLPISVIEATTFGLPIITSNIEAFKPFQNNSSLNINLDDINDLANKMEHMALNLDTMTKNSLENIEHYRTKFDIVNVSRKYLDLYIKVLNEK